VFRHTEGKASRKEEQDMKRSFKTAVVAFAAAMFLAAGVALADHHAVKVAKKDGVGSFLVDTKGMTLYQFKKDMPGTSACEGECVAKWPVYYRDAVAAADGLKAGDFGTITRADGRKQTTYKGMPLYYFAGDKAAGDTNGQGVKDVWFVVNP
jgi:predicted lipoprotein with Yx(FWY)xxD motif